MSAIGDKYIAPEDRIISFLEYANKMQADLTNWNFVTGKREEIYSIANYYFVNVLEDVRIEKFMKQKLKIV